MSWANRVIDILFVTQTLHNADGFIGSLVPFCWHQHRCLHFLGISDSQNRKKAKTVALAKKVLNPLSTY
jgi:hypothetical protein